MIEAFNSNLAEFSITLIILTTFTGEKVCDSNSRLVMNNTKVNYMRKMNVGSVTTPVYKLDGHTQNHRPPLEIYVLLEYHLPSLKVCTVKL